MHDTINVEPRARRYPFFGLHERGAGDPARWIFSEGFLSEGLLESLNRVTTELPEIFSTPEDDALPSARRLVAGSAKDGYSSGRWF